MLTHEPRRCRRGRSRLRSCLKRCEKLVPLPPVDPADKHNFPERPRLTLRFGDYLSPVDHRYFAFRAFGRIKAIADKKKEIFDEDLETIVEEEISKIPEKFGLLHFYIASGDQVKPTASIKLKYNNKILEGSSTGDGPVDACYKAVDKITGISGKLLDYQIRSVTSGKDALGEVSVKISSKGNIVSGRGASTDIIEASVKAYINAANKLVYKSPGS